MRFIWASLLCVGLSLAVGRSSAAQSLEDFGIPAVAEDPEAAREVESPADVSVARNKALDVDVVSSESAQDAVNTASARLVEAGGGVMAITTSSGIGFVATGQAGYTPPNNPDLAAVVQRWASLEAMLKAKRELAQFLTGLSGEGRMMIASESTTVMNEEFSATNSSKNAEQQASEVISAMLRGAILYDYQDDPDKNKVSVSVVVTPRTMGAVRQIDSSTVTAESLQAGMQYVLNEIKGGLVPPMGGRTIVIPETGETVWVGFGCQNIISSDDPDAMIDNEEDAKEFARGYANNSLIAIMNGEQVDAQGQFAEKFNKVRQEMDVLLAETGEESVSKRESALVQQSATRVRSNTIGSVTRGKLPPGVQTRIYTSEDTPWVYAVSICRASDSAAARELAKMMSENSPLGAVDAQAKKLGFQMNPDGTIKRDANGKPILKSLGKGRVTPDKDL